MRVFRIKDGRSALVGWAIASAGAVALTAFSGSYQHQYQLLARFGQAHWYAAVQPLSVEGLVFTATLMMALAAVAGKTMKQTWPAYLALAIGTGQAALANMAVSYSSWWWMRIEINVWPAVAFFIAYEMVSWMIRNRRPVAVNEGQRPGDAPPTPRLPVPKVVPMPDRLPRKTEPYFEPAPQETAEPQEFEIPESDDLPSDMMVSVAGLRELEEEQYQVKMGPLELPTRPISLVNGSEPVHTCNDGAGPRGGKKTPGCPRCDAIVAGLIAPKGQRRSR